jgi:Domain of unknown function (DUF1707)/Cell wall-active antibiotics response 4TMS YvqF
MIPAEGGDSARMRISDAERDQAASLLSEALAQGRLTADEHAERLDRIYAAKTQADIMPVVSDLPGAVAALVVPGTAAPGTAAGTELATSDSRRARRRNAARLVCLFSSISRTGAWAVPPSMRSVTVFADTTLDLRQARLSGSEVSIEALAVFGNTTITVPPEMHVVDEGYAVLGGREIPPDSEESARPGAPVLRITGVSLLGMVTVRRQNRGLTKQLPSA